MRQANRRPVSDMRYPMRWKSLPKGLKKLNIGENVWYIGKEKVLKDERLHQVIYGPENKEYHIYNETVESLRGDYDKQHPDYAGEYFNRDGNKADQAKVKIYILTSILDDRDNWCFDLNCIPERNKLKVIYSNGTIKNIDFDGEFKPVEISGDYHREVKPVGYRVK